MDDHDPNTVKHLLVELKDASELMVDLAYAAVFFDEEKLAEEVGRLDERSNVYLRKLRQIAMLAARSPEDAEGMAGALWIADAVQKIGEAGAGAARRAARQRARSLRAGSRRRHPRPDEGPCRGGRWPRVLVDPVQQPDAGRGGRRPRGALGRLRGRARVVGPACRTRGSQRRR